MRSGECLRSLNGFQRRKMKEYELVVLYHPDLEVDIAKATEKVAKIIADAKGKIIKQEDWGRKKLAYPIKGEKFAIYSVYALELPAAAPKKINDILNITNEVIRFLLTSVDPKIKALIEEEEQREKEEGGDEVIKETED